MKIHSNCESHTTKNVTALTIQTDKPLGFHINIAKKIFGSKFPLSSYYNPLFRSIALPLSPRVSNLLNRFIELQSLNHNFDDLKIH